LSAVLDVGSRTGRRNPLVWIALAISLVLNLFIVGGLVWSMRTAENIQAPAERFMAIGRGLSLNGDQRAALERFGMSAREHGRLLRQSNAPLMQQVWQEMGAAKPDETRIEQLVERATQNRLAYQKAMTAGLMIFLDSLSAEQRAEFAALAAHHAEPQGGRVLRLVIP
jgi:uncharacterized membrane protein